MSRRVAIITALERAMNARDEALLGELASRAMNELPGDVSALALAAGAFEQAGSRVSAIDACRRALRVRPGDPAIVATLVRLLVLESRAMEATQAAASSTALSPELAIWGARAMSAVGRSAQASAILDQAASQWHTDASLLAESGLMRLNIGDAAGAVTRLKSALAVGSDADIASNLAKALRLVGDESGAEVAYGQSLAINPRHADSTAGLAEIFASRGETARALELIDRAHANGAASVELDVALARLVRKSDRRDEAIGRLSRDVADTGQPKPVRAMAAFSLGELLEAAGNFDGACRAFIQGNELMPKPVPPDFAHRDAAAIRDVFTRGTIRAVQASASESERPVFIVGMPRSGTSLVEQIIDSHPLCHGAGELEVLPRLAAGIDRRRSGVAKYPRGFFELRDDERRAIGEEYLTALDQASPLSPRVTDKLPHNFLHVGMALSLFPRARVIHCTRDPRDTCLSCFTTLFSPLHSWSTSFEGLVGAYRACDEMMSHWSREVGDRMFVVRYENLVTDPRRTIEAMIAFLGVPWDEACLSHERSGRVVRTASRDQATQAMYGTSIGRWRRFEPWIRPLIDGLEPFVASAPVD